MKNKILLASGITMLSNSLAIAGGWESSALSTSFLYEKGGENGGYAEVAFGSRDYEITDSATAPNVASAPSSSAVKDQSATTISFKYAVTDEISLGFSRYKQGSIQLDYSGAGSAAAAALPVVDLTINANVLMGKYSFNENISVLAGVKQTVVEDAIATIFQSVPAALGGPYGTTSVSGDSELGYVYGASYSRDDIALRVELTAETSTDLVLASSNPSVAGQPATGNTNASTPDYLNLYVQSGIAEDTLAFGSIRRANWSENQIYVYPHGGTATSSFDDSTTYNLGVGRKFSENFSGSISYSTEPEGSSASDSHLSITNGYRGITVGGKYTRDNMSITAGYNYTQLGDVTLSNATLGSSSFSDNTVTGFGVRLGFSF